MHEHRVRVGRIVASIGAVLLLAAVGPVPAGAEERHGLTGRAASDRCYIGVVHTIFLDRPATEAEKQGWSDRFDAGDPQYLLPQALANGDEWLSVVVTGLYQQALDRDPDAGGLVYWIGRLRAGDAVNRVASLIYGSGEYYARAGGTDEAFVADLYERILHRSPDRPGQTYWQGQIARRGRGAVAALFFASGESRGDRVDALYDQILGRAPDPAGRAYWVGRLATVNDVRLAVQLASSGELRTRAPSICARTTRITDVDTFHISPDISDDGRFVAIRGPRTPGGPVVISSYDTSTGESTLVPTDSTEPPSDPTTSADGGHIAFAQRGPTGGVDDILTWDRTTGSTTRITAGDDGSTTPAISADGRHITFASAATDLVPDDTNGQTDIFTWDRATGTTTRITDGNGDSSSPTLSSDGRHIAFSSSASDLVPDDTNGQPDIFTWDRATGTTTRITDGNAESLDPHTSADGRHIAFSSSASDLVLDDTNGLVDAFTWDRTSGAIDAITDGVDNAFAEDISADGDHIAILLDKVRAFPLDVGRRIEVWHRTTATTTAVPTQVELPLDPAISGDGRAVVFADAAGFGLDREPAGVYLWTDLG